LLRDFAQLYHGCCGLLKSLRDSAHPGAGSAAIQAPSRRKCTQNLDIGCVLALSALQDRANRQLLAQPKTRARPMAV
jgi:hypothetical protein